MLLQSNNSKQHDKQHKITKINKNQTFLLFYSKFYFIFATQTKESQTI